MAAHEDLELPGAVCGEVDDVRRVAERVGDARAGVDGQRGDDLVAGLGDQELTGRHGARVQIGEAAQGGPVGATGSADDDSGARFRKSGHGYLLETALKLQDVRIMLVIPGHQFK